MLSESSLHNLCGLHLLRARRTAALLALDCVVLRYRGFERRVLGLASKDLSVSSDQEER